jgi:hypothetical protein
MSLNDAWDRAVPFSAFLPTAKKYPELWEAQWRRSEIPATALARVNALPGAWRLLVLNEDWCGDSVNTVPLMARLASESSTLELRLLGRDVLPPVMDAFLTGESRSIPKAIVIDAEGVAHGAWGPRPAPLQSWVLGEGRTLDATERYKQIRAWYVRDRGATMINELVAVLEAAAPQVAAGTL